MVMSHAVAVCKARTRTGGPLTVCGTRTEVRTAEKAALVRIYSRQRYEGEPPLRQCPANALVNSHWQSN